MSNLIQFKRSLNTAIPASLANGEPAYTANGDVLYIGSNGAIVAVGGKRFPGVLTANQALVANATSFIDEIKTAKLTIGGATSITSINAVSNSSVLGLASNAEFTTTWAIKTYVDAVVAAVGGVAALDDLTDVTLSTRANGHVLVYSNASVGWINVPITGAITISNTGLVAIAADAVTLGTHTSGNYVASLGSGNGLTGGAAGSEGAALTLAVVANSGLVSNSTGVFVLANNGITANSTGVFVTAANGISVAAGGVAVTAGASGGLVSNTTGVFITAGSGLLTNSTGIHVGSGNGISTAADAVYVNGGSTLTVNTTGVHVNSTLSLTDLTLSGNLTINGTLTTVDATNLTVKDSMIELANGNTTTDALDIGFYGQYGATGAKFTGLFRDATDGVYKLFTGLTAEPSTTVDTANLSYTIATLNTYLHSGALVSNATNIAITANSTLAVAFVANTLSLSTALPATSGGTGLNTFTSGDILVANTGNVLSKLALGADGLILQSNGTAVIYSSLDGGLF